MPRGSSVALIARITSSATGSLARASRSRFNCADAVLGRDRAGMARDDRMDDLVHRRPVVEKRRLVGADRLADVEMDVAVAEVAEGDDARAGHERLDRRASPRARKAGTAPTGTDTSCLIEPPCDFCASDIASRSAPERLALLERRGERRVLDQPALERVAEQRGHRVVEAASRPATRPRSARTRHARASSGSRAPGA